MQLLFYTVETPDHDTMNETFVARKRIKSFQSNDSLDKWRESDVINELEEIELTGKYIYTRNT